MSVANPVQFYDDVPAFAGADFEQYHEAFYEVPHCDLCEHELVHIIQTSLPIFGKRIFGVHPVHLSQLKETT